METNLNIMNKNRLIIKLEKKKSSYEMIIFELKGIISWMNRIIQYRIDRALVETLVINYYLKYIVHKCVDLLSGIIVLIIWIHDII